MANKSLVPGAKEALRWMLSVLETQSEMEA